MYLLSVIPLIKIPHPAPQILDYFSHESVHEGGIVEIPIGSRYILGVVSACTPLIQQRQQIKKLPYMLRAIEKIISKNPVVPSYHIKLILWTSQYFYASLGLTARSLLPNIFGKPTKKFIRELGKTDMRDLGSPSSPCGIYETPHGEMSSKRPTLYWAHHNNREKIRFYTKEIKKAIDNKKSILFLVPELYKIDYFQNEIPQLKNAQILNSRQTPATQYRVWEKVMGTDISMLIGTRSALSIPLPNIGLIVVDEEESLFYKSFDQQPYINAKDIALRLAKLAQSRIILGSNFPSVESLWKAKEGQYQLIEAKSKKRETGTPDVQIIDMRKEIKEGNYSILSRELQTQLKNIIDKNEQAILFINRKGLSTGLLCRDCGHIIKCLNCDVPMVFHAYNLRLTAVSPPTEDLPKGNSQLICHHCGKRQKPPTVCPKCDSYRIKYVGAGTQRVEQELKKFCDEHKLSKDRCRIARLDLDTAATWAEQKRTLDDFRGKKYSILVGTQLMLKENLLPKASLVSIITIDSVLSLPDFRISEQVLHIVDRLLQCSKFSNNRGKNLLPSILLQTYIIDNFVITNVLNSSLETDKNSVYVHNKFVSEDLKTREELSLPPFSQLIKLSYSHRDPLRAEHEAKVLKNKLQTQANSLRLTAYGLRLLGPVPTFIPRVKNRYVWQIVIKSKIDDLPLRNKLLRIVPSDWKIDVDPIELL